MKLAEQEVAEIRAARGVYRPADVARHYDIHRSTVTRIWAGAIWAGAKPANEPPNIISRPRPSELDEDIRTLLHRGLSPKEVAAVLNISVRSVYQYKGIWV